MTDDFTFEANFREGVSAFQSARRQAFWQEMMDHLRGKPAELLSFEDIRARLRLHAETYKGLQDVPLDKIVGSVGRYHDFTRNFLPKDQAMQERWSRVYAKTVSLEGLPPIEVYKIGDVYFVRDGNHRVSVARRLGAKTIQAHVTEVPAPIEISPDMSPEELDLAAAHAEFLKHTRLSSTRPHHQPIRLTEPSRYHELLGHIHLHQRILEKTQGRKVEFDEAAADWYDNVYRPGVTLIRKYNVLDKDSQRSEADLYLWLVDHLREVKEHYGDQTGVHKLTDALVDFLKENRLPVPEELLGERDPEPVELMIEQEIEQMPEPAPEQSNGRRKKKKR